MKKLTIFLLLALVILVSHEAIVFLGRQKIDWAEGHISLSPNKRWAVLLRSTSTSLPQDSFVQILVFDTELYPKLKKDGAFPSKAQCRNPRASFLVPVQLFARMTDFQWGTGGQVVEIVQGEVNALEPVAYRLDLESFSLTRIDN